jgi:16S rRNA processing protein RimM
MAKAATSARICVAKIGAAHGVRGELRLWPFTQDPLDAASYGPLETKDGKRRFEVAHVRVSKDHLVARLKGVETREAAEALNGVELYVSRDQLPPPEEDEFFYADLIGLRAVDREDQPLGEIVAVHNFGAGDLIELRLAAGGITTLLPFSKAVVPVIDLGGGRVVIELPNEVEADEGEDRDEAPE